MLLCVAWTGFVYICVYTVPIYSWVATARALLSYIYSLHYTVCTIHACIMTHVVTGNYKCGSV